MVPRCCVNTAILIIAVFVCCGDCGADHLLPEDVLPGQDLGDLNRCGPIALQVCAVASGRATGSKEIEAILPRDGREWSLSELDACARQLGMHTFAAKWRNVPPSIEAPAIIPIKRAGVKHFVSLVGRRGEKVLIVDPPFEPVWIPIEQLHDELKWEGYALHVSANPISIQLLKIYMYARELWLVLAICMICVCVWRSPWNRRRALSRPAVSSART